MGRPPIGQGYSVYKVSARINQLLESREVDPISALKNMRITERIWDVPCLQAPEVHAGQKC